MAEREEVFDVTIPAKTPRGTPVTIETSFAPGTVVGLELVIPPGPAGFAGIAFAQAHQRVLPRTLGAFFVGDDEVIRRDLEGYLNTGSWEVVGFNEDVNNHTFEVRYQIMEITSTIAPAASSAPLEITPNGEVSAGEGSAAGSGTSTESSGTEAGSGSSSSGESTEKPAETPTETAPTEEKATTEAAPEAPATEESAPPAAEPEPAAAPEAEPAAAAPEAEPQILLQEGLQGGEPKFKPAKGPAPKRAKTPKRKERTVTTHRQVRIPITRGTGEKVLAAARRELGVPYRWGGESEHHGFDCSGLSQYAYAAAGIHIPRDAQEQYDALHHVNESDAQPGDLVFFGGSASDVSHVGIYVSRGIMVDATHTGAYVEYSHYLPGIGSVWGTDKLIGYARPIAMQTITETKHVAPPKKAPAKHEKAGQKRKPAAKHDQKDQHKRAPAKKEKKPPRPKRVKAPKPPRPKKPPRAPKAPRPKRPPKAKPAHRSHR